MFGKEKKINIKGLSLEEIDEIFENINEDKFRSKQLFLWLYQKKIDNFSQITNFSSDLKKKLDKILTIQSIELQGTFSSGNSQTKKYLFGLSDDSQIESVIIPEQDRNTLCISTQVGCPVFCRFCATGQMGFKRNLTSGEIIDQYIQVSNVSSLPISNVVYMGMGEPFLNWENTIKTLNIFSSELAIGISAKRITVSTVGIPERIREFADVDFKGKLAFSLHSTNESTRSLLIPLNEKYSLKENTDALEYFYKKTKRRITFEYTLLKGINDSENEINGIIKLTKKIPSKINIIPFNSIMHTNPDSFSSSLKPVSGAEFDSFVQKLRDNFVTVFVRNTNGDDISGACGQLAISNKKTAQVG